MHNKVILACGADFHDKTDEIHPDNVELFEKAAYLCRVSLIGIDFICQDISLSYKNQLCAILEVNSIPYIDMHHFPVTGKPRNVARAMFESIFTETKNRGFPGS